MFDRAIRNGNRDLVWILLMSVTVRVAVSLARILLGIHPISWLPSLAMWNDFDQIYGHQLKLLSEGFLPYKDFAYSYTPLFLYILLPFYMIGGIFAAGTPIVLFDALSALLVYEVMSLGNGRRLALWGALTYSFLPLVIFNIDYLWLGRQPVTFFILLSVYYFHRRKYMMSSASMALATLFQQEAIFAFPVLMLWQIKKNGKAAWKGIMLFLAILFGVSAPFLIIDSQSYLSQISYGIFANMFTGSSSIVTADVSSLTSSGVSSIPFLGICPTTPILVTLTHFSCVQYPLPILTAWVNTTAWISNAIVTPYMLLLAVALYAARTHPNAVELLISYSIIGFLLVFSLLVHETLTYYFVPVYAILICTSCRRISLFSILLLSTLSMTVSSGPFPEVLAQIGLLITAATK